MVEIETVTETETAIVTGMAAAAADEMMTRGRENDITKVMGMMTREVKEGTKLIFATASAGFSTSKTTAVCW